MTDNLVSVAVSTSEEILISYTVTGHISPVLSFDLLNAIQLPQNPGERCSVSLITVLPVSVQEDYFLNIFVDPHGNGRYYSCISKTGHPDALRQIYSFLNEVQRVAEDWYSNRGRKRGVSSTIMADDIRELTTKWNSITTDQMEQVKLSLSELKNTVKDVLKITLVRQERIEEILGQSEHIVQSAMEFQDSANQISWKMWFRKNKWNILIGIILLSGIAFIIFLMSKASNSSPSHPILSANVSNMPQYSGDKKFKGTVTLEDMSSSSFMLVYNLSGLETFGGIHIHEGISCNVPGLHLYKTNSDPWKTLTFVTPPDAEGEVKGSFEISTGYTAAQCVNHVVVVHDGNSNKIACGILF